MKYEFSEADLAAAWALAIARLNTGNARAASLDEELAHAAIDVVQVRDRLTKPQPTAGGTEAPGVSIFRHRKRVIVRWLGATLHVVE